MCVYFWHNLPLIISIFVKPALAIPSCENDNMKFFRGGGFLSLLVGISFSLPRFVSVPWNFLLRPSFSFYLSFEFSFSFNLNNSFGRPLHRFSNKIAGTIFVRSSFLIPSPLAIPPRLSVCLRPSTLSPSTFRLIWPRTTPAHHYRELSVSQSSINFFGPQSAQRQSWRSIWRRRIPAPKTIEKS